MNFPNWDTEYTREAVFHELARQLLTQEKLCFFDTSSLAPGANPHAGNGHGQAGAPDFVVLISGRFIAIELKAASGKMTAAQERMSLRVTEAGGEYCCVTTLREVADVCGIETDGSWSETP